ncbi:DNA-processing protein DprA (plasmid) [Streptosporangium sp. CA-135522]|uniref:DNA-processing protein DprA n=1 Tax=Streptosporangium sp. CA-135522 TaxID=3240072 RepID=UPI003D8BEBD5
MTDSDLLSRLTLMRLAEPGSLLISQLVQNLGAVATVEAIRSGTLKELHAAAEDDDAGELTRQLPDWQKRLEKADPVADLEAGQKSGARFLTPAAAEWPTCLDDLGTVQPLGLAQPLGLWARGPVDLRAACQRAVTIAGSQAGTPYGVHVATRLASGVGEAGYTVVSELTPEIGAAAHRGALGELGATVAVLPSGIDMRYPQGHHYLFDVIADQGVLISECPPGTISTWWRTWARHRITAALGQATVIVEATWDGGTMAIANRAEMLRRPLGAVPGPIASGRSQPCNWLIRDRRAVLIHNPEHVIALAALDADPQEHA